VPAAGYFPPDLPSLSMLRPRLALLVLLALVARAEAQPHGPDPIRPLALVAGETATVAVADLVVTDRPLAFGSTEAVAVGYDPSAGTLALTTREGFEGLALVSMVVGGDTLALPVRSRVQTRQGFTYPAGEAGQVNLFGQFNEWDRGRTPLARQADGSWAVSVPLDPGRYEYKFFVDGEEVMDPANPVTVPNGFGGFNNVLVVPPSHAEAVALHTLRLRDGTARFAFERGGRPAAVVPEEVVVLLDNRPLPPSAVSTERDRVTVTVPEGASGRLRVAVVQGGQATPFGVVHLDGGRLAEGFRWHDAILYQIMVDRFYDGDPARTRPVAHDSVAARANYHGGDLQGILDKLREGFFERLGVNTLWLSPVIENTDRAHREYPPPHRFYTGYHGYWPTHPRRVEERFGDMALLQGLVREAQGRGLRVLLDFVANHTHEDHPYFQNNPEWFGTLELPDGQKNLRLWDEQRLTTWFEPYLPSFDFEGSDEALEAVTDDAVWWLRASGADGFRHDAVKHVPNQFWRTLTRKIREEVDPERPLPAYQIGETFGSYDLISSYVLPGQLDAQFNFNLYDTQLHAFLDEGAGFEALDAEVHRGLDVYGTDHLMGTLLDSHDKARFLAFADGDIPRDGTDDQEIGWERDIRVDDPASYRRAELVLAYLLTTPGVPTIYYGVEFGMTGANDPDNRRPMRFGADLSPEERGMRVRVTRLLHLRRDRPALRRGGFHTLHAEGDTWAYLRASAEGRVLVALNKGAEEATLTLTLPAALGEGQGRDALSGEAVPLARGEVVLSVPANGYRIVVLEEDPSATPPAPRGTRGRR
jgi:cyclomaltodextrinase / maltogenic alpha-amylase / neopullulanase